MASAVGVEVETDAFIQRRMRFAHPFLVSNEEMALLGAF